MSASLRHRARWAYETGRAAAAWPEAALAAALGLVAGRCECDCGFTLLLAPLLAVVVTALAWRSAMLQRAARLGMVAGLVPFSIPIIACNVAHACSGDSCRLLSAACIAGGALAGGVVALLALRTPEARRPTILVAGAIAFLVGSLGCSPAGLAGLAATAGGLLVTTMPAVLARDLRA